MILFENLSEKKQINILNAAFLCFGENGYEKTSVADIAKEAGISKASIFQYFGTKRKLYLYLFQVACEKIVENLPQGNDDLFDSIQRATRAKIKVMEQHPGMYDFLSSIVNEGNQDIMTSLHSGFDMQIMQGAETIFQHVNWDKFRPELSKEKILHMIRWVNDGYVQSAVGKKDAETMYQELQEYMGMLKKSMYRKEYL